MANWLISWFWNSCNPCSPKFLAAEEWETINQNHVFYTNYMFGSIPVGVQAGRTVELSYDLNKGLYLFQDEGLITPGPVGCASFAWPMQTTGFYNAVSVNYFGGASTWAMVPCTIPYGLLNNGLGDGFYDQTGHVYSLRPDLGYPVGPNCMAATIDLSVHYLDVEIFSTTLSFNYSGFKYALPPGWGEVGVAVYLLTSVTMSNLPQTPFEISPAVFKARGNWLYPHKLDGPYAKYMSYYAPPPINPDSGNYQVKGFVYDGPLDRSQEIVFKVKAIGTAAPSYPPPAKLYASLQDFESNVAQPPVIDTQFIMGQGLYGSYGDPVKVYDYQHTGF